MRASPRSSGLVVGLAACLGSQAARADSFATPLPDPSAIFNGTDASECAFPSAVGMRVGGQIFCTGTLIHPQVVLFAAHCLDTSQAGVFPDDVMFGENADAPARSIPVTDCQFHPDWQAFGIDLAACILPVAVHQVPITPMIMGCEVDALIPNTDLTIVGFGATAGFVDEEGNTSVEGVGRKRFTHQRLTDVLINDNDGTWNPSPGCGGFPLDPGTPETTWKNACAVTQTAGWSSTCGPPFSDGPFPQPPPEPPPPPEPKPEPPPEPIPEPDPVPPPPPPPPPPPDDTGATPTGSDSLPDPSDSEPSSGDIDSAGDLADRGCTCTTSPSSGAPFALLLMLALGRRRRPNQA